ncbi:hypothetical protein KI387_010592, partial [Taxus chinensis]
MPLPDVVSWTVMIAGYTQNGLVEKALETFKKMQVAGVKSNSTTFISILPACAKMGALEQGMDIHQSIIKSGILSDVVVASALVDIHGGLVDEACKYFNGMSDPYCTMPTMDHYICIVDLLGRAGYIEEALNFIIKMPIKPASVVWVCLLGACRSHKNIGLGISTATLLFELNPKNAAPYVLLSNIYAEVGRWGDVKKVRRLMKDRGTKKIPGCSWVEVRKMVHVFCVGDRSHQQTKDIHAKLEKLSGEMKAAGYLPDLRQVLSDVEEEEKELFLGHHSEKLAIAFGLVNTSPGTTLTVVKNLRVCDDCHTAAKFISKIVSREIVVRDANR